MLPQARNRASIYPVPTPYEISLDLHSTRTNDNPTHQSTFHNVRSDTSPPYTSYQYYTTYKTSPRLNRFPSLEQLNSFDNVVQPFPLQNPTVPAHHVPIHLQNQTQGTLIQSNKKTECGTSPARWIEARRSPLVSHSRRIGKDANADLRSCIWLLSDVDSRAH